MNAPSHLDLFSGIGGFSVAAEHVGFETVAFCETDPDASLVLEYWWPHVPNLGDVKNLRAGRAPKTTRGRALAYRRRFVDRGIDLLTGGVPCQPTSHLSRN